MNVRGPLENHKTLGAFPRDLYGPDWIIQPRIKRVAAAPLPA
jgi:hypothetical protein